MVVREENTNYGRTSKPANTVHLSTSQPIAGGQKPLVKIQRAELVKFKRAPTIRLLFKLDAPILLVEWISPEDPRFRQIAKTHGDLYENLSNVVFEQSLQAHFRVLDRLTLASKTRTLYLCERR